MYRADKSAYQLHEGGTSLFSSSNDFSERYSWTNATVTTIMMATVIEMASSNCRIHTLTTAEPGDKENMTLVEEHEFSSYIMEQAPLFSCNNHNF